MRAVVSSTKKCRCKNKSEKTNGAEEEEDPLLHSDWSTRRFLSQSAASVDKVVMEEERVMKLENVAVIQVHLPTGGRGGAPLITGTGKNKSVASVSHLSSLA